MDPNQCYREILELAAKLWDGIGCGDYKCLDHYEGDVDRLCERITALDTWLSKGGFLPDNWKKKEQASG
jgi:hypothetical protein